MRIGSIMERREEDARGGRWRGSLGTQQSRCAVEGGRAREAFSISNSGNWFCFGSGTFGRMVTAHALLVLVLGVLRLADAQECESPEYLTTCLQTARKKDLNLRCQEACEYVSPFQLMSKPSEPNLTYPHLLRRHTHGTLPHMPRTCSGVRCVYSPPSSLPRRLRRPPPHLIPLTISPTFSIASFFIASCNASTCATRSLSSRPSTSRSSPQRRPWTWYDICLVAHIVAHTRSRRTAPQSYTSPEHFVCALVSCAVCEGALCRVCVVP